MSFGPGHGPAPASAWNTVAFRAGERLLRAWVAVEAVPEHVADLWIAALACVGAEEELRTEAGRVHVWSLLATARPFGLGMRSAVHDALLGLFTWGTRRAARDRKVRESLPELLAAVADARAELAGVAGEDPDAARRVEEAAQAADVAEVLGGA